MIPSLMSALGSLLLEGIGFLTGFITSGSAFPKPLSPEEEGNCSTAKKKETKVPATCSLSGTFVRAHWEEV